MGRISALTELTSLANDDYLVVLDSSANIAKKISIANAFGIPEFGWTATGESWSYSAWDSGNRTATITVPSDATTKYSKGMKVRFSQSTGGTKYGFITEVNSTSIKVYMGTDYTLNNETISTPHYSSLKAPFGFPLDPIKWTVELSSSNDRSTTSTSLASLTDAITLPIGSWFLDFRVFMSITVSTTSSRNAMFTLSSNGSSETDSDLSVWLGTQTVAITVRGGHYRRKTVTVTSPTTYTAMGRVTSASASLTIEGASTPTVIRAICAYL